MTKPPINQPCLARLHEVFDLDVSTGVVAWRASPSPRAKVCIGAEVGGIGGGYRRVRLDGVLYRVHRIVWSMFHGRLTTLQIDHINCDTLDNRPENLREATHSQNSANVRRYSTARNPLRGALWREAKGKWQAKIRVQQKTLHIGYFDTAEEAHAAFAAEKIRHYGEFARLA